MNYQEKIVEKLKTEGKFRIAFVGDSLTSTEWVHPNWREMVEYVLKEELEKKFEDWRIASWGIRCFNLGFDGATTEDVLKKSDEIVEIKPNLVIGLMGGNDPIFGISPEQSGENLKAIFEKFEENKIDFVWTTALPDLRKTKNEIYQPYRKIILSLKNTLDLFEWYMQWNLDDFYTFRSEEKENEGIQSGEIDPMHPNQLGNAYIAAYILDKVFEINFYPEKYVETTLTGEKFPAY